MPGWGTGIARRMDRLAPGGKAILVPMDHGVSMGIPPGLERPAETVRKVVQAGATGVIVHKGLVRDIVGELGACGLMIHASASTGLNPDPNDKRLVASVSEAARAGADGFSVHVNVGATTESRMVEDLGLVAEACEDTGLPLLAMMYPRGPAIQDPHDPDLVGHVVRLAYELGADLIKAPYTGSPDTFAPICEAVSVPVVISGGARMDSDQDVLAMVHDAVGAGARGVSIGRNIWQRDDPSAMVAAIRGILYDGKRPDELLVP